MSKPKLKIGRKHKINVNPFLTDRGLRELNNELDKAYGELLYIEEHVKPNAYDWRMQKQYINGLEFLLDVEEV